MIDGDDPGVLAENRLTGTLRQFGYDVRSQSVVVVFDAVRPGEGAQVQTRRFEARVPGVTADVASVGPALNQAANEVAGQVGLVEERRFDRPALHRQGNLHLTERGDAFRQADLLFRLHSRMIRHVRDEIA